MVPALPPFARCYSGHSGASVGVSVAYGSWDEAWGSLLQLLLNVVLLIVVGAGGLSTQRLLWRRRAGRGS